MARKPTRDVIGEFIAAMPSSMKRPSLLDFVKIATPRFERPSHLAAVATLIERARTEPIRAVISAPPRHGKSELFHHAIPWQLHAQPGTRMGYATYGQRFSERRSARNPGR